MTGTNRRIYKLISLVTAIMIVCSCFPVFANNTGKVSARDPVEIKSFKTGLTEGAEKQDDDKYVWTPLVFSSGHKFILPLSRSSLTVI